MSIQNFKKFKVPKTPSYFRNLYRRSITSENIKKNCDLYKEKIKIKLHQLKDKFETFTSFRNLIKFIFVYFIILDRPIKKDKYIKSNFFRDLKNFINNLIQYYEEYKKNSSEFFKKKFTCNSIAYYCFIYLLKNQSFSIPTQFLSNKFLNENIPNYIQHIEEPDIKEIFDWFCSHIIPGLMEPSVQFDLSESMEPSVQFDLSESMDPSVQFDLSESMEPSQSGFTYDRLIKVLPFQEFSDESMQYLSTSQQQQIIQKVSDFLKYPLSVIKKKLSKLVFGQYDFDFYSAIEFLLNEKKEELLSSIRLLKNEFHEIQDQQRLTNLELLNEYLRLSNMKDYIERIFANFDQNKKQIIQKVSKYLDKSLYSIINEFYHSSLEFEAFIEYFLTNHRTKLIKHIIESSSQDQMLSRQSSQVQMLSRQLNSMTNQQLLDKYIRLKQEIKINQLKKIRQTQIKSFYLDLDPN
jgi:hypothetical protein